METIIFGDKIDNKWEQVIHGTGGLIYVVGFAFN